MGNNAINLHRCFDPYHLESGEQVFGTIAGDRKNLVNQYSDQKVKY